MRSSHRRVALVTGAGGGIGAAICMRLSLDGIYVFAADIDLEAAKRSIENVESSNGDGAAIALDVGDENSWSAAIQAIRGAVGRLDILVNNAGVAAIKPLEELTASDWSRDIRINLTGPFLGIKECLPLMKESARGENEVGGAIINVCSVSALVGSPGMPSYSASKGGLRLFSKAIALDFVKRKYNIRVNSIFPGLIDTPLTVPLIESVRAKTGAAEFGAVRQAMIDRYPIGRIGEPVEIAGVVSFLAGKDASFMVGAELAVDGGFTAE